MNSPRVVTAKILVYPFKSLPAAETERAVVLPSGALEHDRRFCLLDADGNLLNGKRTAAIHTLRATHDLTVGSTTLWTESAPEPRTFSWSTGRPALAARLSELLGTAVSIRENAEEGFPDDREAPGPTVVSTATLAAVAEWFPGLDPAETRARFRANLELSAPFAFWEDLLFGPAGTAPEFRVGGVTFAATNPCRRCVVPSRDSRTGVVLSGFQKTFAQRRAASLPEGVAVERFDHYYRLTVNTRLAPGCAGGLIRVGDAVEILPRY